MPPLEAGALLHIARSPSAAASRPQSVHALNAGRPGFIVRPVAALDEGRVQAVNARLAALVRMDCRQEFGARRCCNGLGAHFRRQAALPSSPRVAWSVGRRLASHLRTPLTSWSPPEDVGGDQTGLPSSASQRLDVAPTTISSGRTDALARARGHAEGSSSWRPQSGHRSFTTVNAGAARGAPRVCARAWSLRRVLPQPCGAGCTVRRSAAFLGFRENVLWPQVARMAF